MIRPPGPVPVTAGEVDALGGGDARAATGVALAPVGRRPARRGGGRGGRAVPGEVVAAAARRRRPASGAMTWPTVTVSPSSARISVIVPRSGPEAPCRPCRWRSRRSSRRRRRCRRPSRPLEDRALGDRLAARGGDDVDDLAAGLGLRRPAPRPLRCRSASGAAAAGAAPLVESISHSSWPTSTVSPSPARTFTTVPAVGEGTSASTLSVEISTRISSGSTGSPSFLCHSRTVPSVTDSPIAGMVTCTVVFTAIESLTLARCQRAAAHERIHRSRRTARSRRSRPRRRAIRTEMIRRRAAYRQASDIAIQPSPWASPKTNSQRVQAGHQPDGQQDQRRSSNA